MVTFRQISVQSIVRRRGTHALQYQKIIIDISTQTDTLFRPATNADLFSLQSLGVPKSIVDFYALHEPSKCAEGQIRLWPIKEILQENRDLVPGAYISPFGYVVFATTFCGDTYCFDLNKIDEQTEPGIVLISHEVVSDDIDAQEAARLAKPVENNLFEFLERFTRDAIDEVCIY